MDKSREREKKWQNLTLADDFLFCKIMSDISLCSEMLHRIFPELDVSDIRPVETQKAEKLALHIRGVRFDVFTRIARDIFDVEAQKRRLKDLRKRPRAYHIVMGHDCLNVDTLKKSGGYDDLPNTYVIFICMFDPFGKKRHIYSSQNYCTEDKDIALGDGAYTVFLNTKGRFKDVSPELKRFLDFVGKNQVSEDAFIKTLDEKVREAKENTEWRSEYMALLTIEDEKFAEGVAVGEKRGEKRGVKRTQRSIYERLVADGMPAQKASMMTGWNIKGEKAQS